MMSRTSTRNGEKQSVCAVRDCMNDLIINSKVCGSWKLNTYLRDNEMYVNDLTLFHNYCFVRTLSPP